MAEHQNVDKSNHKMSTSMPSRDIHMAAVLRELAQLIQALRLLKMCPQG